jgi:hypothetical protein
VRLPEALFVVCVGLAVTAGPTVAWADEPAPSDPPVAADPPPPAPAPAPPAPDPAPPAPTPTWTPLPVPVVYSPPIDIVRPTWPTGDFTEPPHPVYALPATPWDPIAQQAKNQIESEARFRAWLQENHPTLNSGNARPSGTSLGSEPSSLQSEYLASLPPDLLDSLETLGLTDTSLHIKPLLSLVSTTSDLTVVAFVKHDVSSRPEVTNIARAHSAVEASGLLLGAATLGFLAIGNGMLRIRRKLRLGRATPQP